MVALKEDKGKPPRKKHPLTDREAFSLLSASNEYFKKDHYLNGRHNTEIVAEAMLQGGCQQLYDEVMMLHTAIKEFHRGDFSEVRYLADGTIFKDLAEQAKKTPFKESVGRIMRDLGSFDKVFTLGKEFDWEKSTEKLAEMKHTRFSQDLTMVEKLNHWQHNKNNGPNL